MRIEAAVGLAVVAAALGAGTACDCPEPYTEVIPIPPAGDGIEELALDP